MGHVYHNKYLFWCSDVHKPSPEESFQLPPGSLWHILVTPEGFVYFVGQYNVPGSSCALPGPALESAIFPRSPGSFPQRILFGNQKLDARLCVYRSFSNCIKNKKQKLKLTRIALWRHTGWKGSDSWNLTFQITWIMILYSYNTSLSIFVQNEWTCLLPFKLLGVNVNDFCILCSNLGVEIVSLSPQNVGVTVEYWMEWDYVLSMFQRKVGRFFWAGC